MTEHELDTLLRDYGGAVRSVCRAILPGHPQDAEEAEADTFYKLWRGAHLPADETHRRRLVVQAARQCAIDRYRALLRRGETLPLDDRDDAELAVALESELETRELMAQLGVKRLVDLIGRTDLLKELEGFTAKQQKLELSKLLETAQPHPGKAVYCTENNPPFDNGVLNAQLLQQAKPYVDDKQSKTFWFDIRNTDRSVGASLSGYIAQTHGDQGLAGDPIVAHFSGTAGQSFGVWNAGGVELHLTGDANDYVGKGMAGGLLAIRPPVGSAFRSHEASIIGNTCLYGATGGRLYAAGRAGERFAVRNSGAITVVEGIGDNGCEYMTGGIVCVLGKTGVNFGAGMTGGFAYVLDEDGDFRKRVNPELVEVLDVDSLAIHEEHLRGLITEHVQLTGSQRGEEILANWPAFSAKFALVKPKSSDVKALLGHRSRSAAELRVQAQ